MSESDRDRGLRQAFAHLRSAIDPLSPDAERMLAATVQKRPPRAVAARLAFAGALCALVLTIAWGSWHVAKPVLDQRTAARREALVAVVLRVPTDFLLDVPGAALLRTTPSLGASMRYST